MRFGDALIALAMLAAIAVTAHVNYEKGYNDGAAHKVIGGRS